jgi:predicted RNA-binding Zn-ribbon protein involved in translation (DUF1610 family)
MNIVYDAAAHIFFCLGKVEPNVFLEALWEQWDSDFCSPELLSRHIRYSTVSYNPRGYWQEDDTGTVATIISGDVLNLGPAVCPQCGHLMILDSRLTFGQMVKEEWECPLCEYRMSHKGRLSKRGKR